MRSVHRLFVLCLVASAAGPALAGDIIQTTDDKMMGNARSQIPPTDADYAASKITVDEENLDKIYYTIEDVPTRQDIAFSKVKKVHHDPGNTPSALLEGRLQLDRANFEEARDSLASVVKDSNAPKWAHAEAAWLIANSSLQSGDLQAADKELGEFRKQFPKSRYVPNAIEARARVLLGLDKVAEAKAEFAALKSIEGLSEDRQLDADFNVIWIDEQVAKRSGDAAALGAVIKAYDTFIAKTSGRAQYDVVNRKAQVGKASTLVALGRADDARQILEKVVGESKDMGVLAAGYTALGNAMVRQNTARDPKVFEIALKHFLRVVVLYADANPDAAAEAQFHAGELFYDLRPTAADQKEKSVQYFLRARRELQGVVQDYPGSPWAKQASARLATLR